MSPQLIAELKQFYAVHPELEGIAVTDQEIMDIETQLNIRIDPMYQDFIQHFGGAYAGLSIHAIKNAECLGNETVIEMTRHAREMVREINPQHALMTSLVISDDGAGNPIYIRTDAQVYIIYHDDLTEKFLAENLEILVQESFSAW